MGAGRHAGISRCDETPEDLLMSPMGLPADSGRRRGRVGLLAGWAAEREVRTFGPRPAACDAKGEDV